MTMYLLDTDICIYWLKGRPEVREQIMTVGLANLAISSITVAELYYGAYNSNRIEQNLDRATQFINEIVVIAPTLSTLQKFGELKANLRRMGQTVADFDLLIASVALSEQRTLVTNNTRHYQRIPNLSLANWAEV
ncbi:type II toxin-antitoxin system VapC family toxin [Alkalinema pantanalense CENA528]|uniref:type II toxin-antitoxin system VapC family toxin n=1 Tax=Alkalinema pantanalense TaxID=1620705 RepID=UPI003D6E875E